MLEHTRVTTDENIKTHQDREEGRQTEQEGAVGLDQRMPKVELHSRLGRNKLTTAEDGAVKNMEN